MLQKKIAALCITSLSLLSSIGIAQEQPFKAVQFRASDLVSSSDSKNAASAPSNADGFIRVAPAPQPASELPSTSPFHSLAVGLTASTLGAGFEVATPLSRTLNLRSGINVFSFAYPFIIDGVNYNAQLHFKSTASTVDWFPGHHSFHISPGILYAKNSMSAIASVGPGQNFELGDQPFLNSVDDPVAGAATVVFPHKIAPMVMMGFGNIIPRSRRHFSIPFEVGVAYTGAPQINVNLNGTACTTDGCVSFASNAEAQASMKQEVSDLNEDLKRIPVYPIVSLGFAYHF
jgi:hypothetical protein